MSSRSQPVVDFTDRPEPGPLRRTQDVLQALLGKVTSLVDVALLLETGGYTVTNAAASPGTSIPASQTAVDFADAFIDNVRVIVRGKNSAAGTVVVTVHDTTTDVELCRVSVVDGTEDTFIGTWTRMNATGVDQKVESRCIGNGAFDPVLYAIHFQGRTVAARA